MLFKINVFCKLRELSWSKYSWISNSENRTVKDLEATEKCYMRSTRAELTMWKEVGRTARWKYRVLWKPKDKQEKQDMSIAEQLLCFTVAMIYTNPPSVPSWKIRNMSAMETVTSTSGRVMKSKGLSWGAFFQKLC